MNSKNRHTYFNQIRAIALILSIFLINGNLLLAADKNITVVEKSNDANDKTSAKNNDNLPAGSTAVEATDLVDAKNKILAQLGTGDCIKDLHFRGHGGPGKQSVGGGVKFRDAKGIDGGANPAWKTDLAGLQGKFCPGATIHLWGCNVGSCNLGAAKLQEIADFFGVTVKGSVNTVYAGQQETYTGPIQTATPNGTTPACLMPTDAGDKAPQAPAKKQATLSVNTGPPLNVVASNPNAFILNIQMSNILSYSELITYPNCTPATTSLINLNAMMTFSTNPNPNLISFFINNLSATLQPFNFCGNPTGINQYALSGNYLAQGTINKTTGAIVGSLSYVQSNSLGSLLFTNDIRGNWAPSGSTMNMQLNSFPSSINSIFIPTLPEWGLILLALSFLTVGLFYLNRRFSF